MSKDDDGDLASFPAMGFPLGSKMDLMEMFFEQLLGSFEPLTMGEHVDKIVSGQPLRNFLPKF